VTNDKQHLFGTQSFLQHSLSEPPFDGKRSVELDNKLQAELWDTGVLYFEPQNTHQADSILLSCGVHGNETAPIEIVEQLVDDIFSGKLTVKHKLLIVIANPLAINAKCREVKENMNRLFKIDNVPGTNDNDERQRSQQLMDSSRKFFSLATNQKYHYDMHTAIRGSFYQKFALSPNAPELPASLQQLRVLSQWGIEAIVITQGRSSTYSAFTANNCGAISFTLELGKAKPFGANELSEFADVIQGLNAAISGEDREAPVDAVTAKQFIVAAEVIKQTDEFRLGFAGDIANFTAFEAGAVLAKDRDYQYVVKQSGERILFPNENVALGQRGLVIIRPVENEKASAL
jgi:succinylglutamate desuccinylase